jgi:amidohydrolase
MDALPIHERNGAPYASEVAGVMHACGHDFHTAGLVGVSQLLRAMHEAGALPPARYRLLFQPSEEGCDEDGKSGGMRMVEEGAMEGVDAVVGLHVGGHLPAGKVFIRPGPFFAGSDEVVVTVRGRSAHAARPHEGIDAIALAALGVVGAQQIVSRGISPAANGVVSFGTVQGGRAMNVIADQVVLGGTLRYFDSAVQARLREGLTRVFGALESMGAEVEVRFHGGYPPVVNEPNVTAWMREAISPLLGESGFLDLEPSMEAEDFAFLAREAPGAFLWLGAALPEPRRHHNPDFDIDEKVLPLASAILAGSAVHIAERLGAGKKGG